MGTKVCDKCGLEKPLSEFYKSSKIKSGYIAHCKDCHRELYPQSKKDKPSAPKIEHAPHLADSVLKELESYNLDKIPGRILIQELRRRGYRGEIELVTVQKVVI